MNKKIRWITQTGVLLALLIALQAITKPVGQLLTGTCVNGVLAVSALLVGAASGVTVALISPILAFMLGIAPQPFMVPVIIVGNTLYVLVLSHSAEKGRFYQVMAWLTAAVCKCVLLYGLTAGVICGVLGQRLLDMGVLKPPMLLALPVTFGWPQLLTALAGGGAALLIVPLVKKAQRH